MYRVSHDEAIADLERRRRRASSMGGTAKLSGRRREKLLNARERVEHLVDPGTWEESGLFATGPGPTPGEELAADGKVTGFGRIDGREVAVVAYDFTVKGSSSGALGERKVGYIKRVAAAQGLPVVFLGESTGARMPDVMGGQGMAELGGPERFLRIRETPWVSATLGKAFGSAAWHAVCSDFNVMRRGAVMAVSSPLLVSHATGEEVDAEELGGWRLHSEVTGFADQVADTDESAIDTVRSFLSYLPSHHNEAPPRQAVPPRSDDACNRILEIVPDNPRQVYDMRHLISQIVDHDSVLELKPRFGRSLITALCRIDGRAVGVVANNPYFKGGSVDADACDKATSFLVLCDSFNIPLVFLVDQPGFLVGRDAERRKIAGKVINWMNALSLCSVPRFMVILRKSYGQAYVNMGGGGTASHGAAWTIADVSFMDPTAAAAIVGGMATSDEQNDNRRQEMLTAMSRDPSAYALASSFGVQTVIDPRQTRAHLIRVLEIYTRRLSGGIGQHRMRTWPTSY